MRIGFKYYDGLKCREPLGVSANKQTIVETRRLCATIQLELKPRTFDYVKRFPDSDRIKQRAGSQRPVRQWHKVCVPNLHIAHFSEAQDAANATVRRIICLASRLR